jgi:hypothetical protein
MAIFDRKASKLAAGPTLLLAADPGPALLDAARLYDPQLRHWPGRLVFGNAVLLFGPAEVTPRLSQQAGLPPGVAVAWYAAAAVQGERGRRTHQAKIADGELLVCGLAARLGGTLFPGPSLPPRALLASVYSEQPVPADEVAAVLRPYAGDAVIEDAGEDSYAVGGERISFYTVYLSPRLYRAFDAPPALGPMRKQPLHHWDLNTGMRPSGTHPGQRLKVAEAALALAARAGGVAVDMFGFRFTTPQDFLLPGGQAPEP